LAHDTPKANVSFFQLAWIILTFSTTLVLTLLATRAIADRLAHTPIIVTTVCPGYCYSSLRSKYQGAEAIFDRFLEIALARTPEEGSRNIIWASVSGPEHDLEDLHGGYVYRCKVKEPSDWIISSEGTVAQDKLWVRRFLV